jgi:hypothetical protein
MNAIKYKFFLSDLTIFLGILMSSFDTASPTLIAEDGIHPKPDQCSPEQTARVVGGMSWFVFLH